MNIWIRHEIETRDQKVKDRTFDTEKTFKRCSDIHFKKQ